MQVNTNEYEFAHGHAPRGRGAWAFWFGKGARRVDTSNVADAHWYHGTYSDARRQAVRDAKAQGFETVVVGS
jgi:hypothetical protein